MAGNISIQAVPLDIGGQLIAPRLNLSALTPSNTSVPLNISWGASNVTTGGTIASTPDPTNNPLWINESASGSTPAGSIGYFGFNTINVTDNLANNEPGGVGALEVKETYGGTSFQGGRSALIVWLNPSSTNTAGLGGSAAASTFYGAATLIASANQPSGGSSTGTCTLSSLSSCYGGMLYGSNPTVSLISGASQWAGMEGEEIDVSASGTNSSVYSKVGLLVAEKPTNTLAGAGGVDTAIGISGGTAPSAGWNYGLALGGLNGGVPFQPSASLIYASQPFGPNSGSSAGWGVDMLGPYFGSGFARSAGFEVGGLGDLAARSVSVGSFSLLSTSSGLTIAAVAGRTATTATLSISAPGSSQYWTIGDKAATPNGGQYEVNSVSTYGASVAAVGSGGTPGTVTLTLAPTYNGASCSVYASFTGTISSSGTLVNSLVATNTGTCTVLPSTGQDNWLLTSSDGSLTGATANVAIRVSGVTQLAPDITANTTGTITASQIGCILPPGTASPVGMNGFAGVYRTCGKPLTILLGNTATSDVTLGSSISTSATTGLMHPFATEAGVPASPPSNTGVACAWNTSSHVLNCYDGSSWYHFTGVSGPS